MQKITSLQLALKPSATLEIVDESGAVQEHRLVMDFNAIAKANELIGRDFADIASWQKLSALDVTTLCWCALLKHHSEATLEQVRSWINPAEVWQLFNLLLELSFPGILDKLGEKQPNLPADNA